MSERRTRDPAPASLSWDEEQRLLGVGVRLRRRSDVPARHGSALAASTRALHEGARGPVEEHVARRLAAVRQRLWRAPAWRDRLRAAGCSPEDLRGLDDLRELPPLGRDEYAARWQDFADVDGDAELHLATSSGSTGQALLCLRSGYDGVHMWAVLRFWIEHLAVALPARPRLVLLDALPGGLEYSRRAPQLERGALHRLSTQRPRPLERLRRSRPAILSSDPAGLHWLLGVTSDGDAGLAPRLLLSSAQHLAPALRQAVAARFPAPLVDYYALTEVGPIAWSCPLDPRRFHVLHPDVWVESQGGELLVTRLRDSPLPLLRYATGDRGATEDAACECGVMGRSIVAFTGREECAFVTPDGRKVDAWALSWLFKDLPLVRFELAQTGPERFQLSLDPQAAIDLELLATRLQRVLVRLGFAAPIVDVRREATPLPAKPRPFRPLP